MNPVSLNSRAHTHASACFSFPLLTPSVCLPLSPPQGLIQTPKGFPLPPPPNPSIPPRHPSPAASWELCGSSKPFRLVKNPFPVCRGALPGQAARACPPDLCFIRRR